MNISEKLDFLMNITNTRNSALGKALSFDPSYISRIRLGRRGIPKSQPFSRPVAAYFSRNIKDRYQLETLSKMIRGDGIVPIDEDELEELIFDWLEDDLAEDASGSNMSGVIGDIGKILEGYSREKPEAEMALGTIDNADEAEGRVVPVGVFYGNQGKRDAVKRFLTSILTQKKPFTLYIYSDEDMSWLYENPAFVKEWMGLLTNILKGGSHIQVIHTIGREFADMMETIRKWLPLYSTGAIEPYYCPKLRDGLYRRSLFIAKGFSAIVSTSVGDKTEEMANFFVRNTETVAAIEAEYHNYLALCRPLMKTYMAKDRDRFMEILLAKKGESGRLYQASSAPSLASMPKEVVIAIAKRAGENSIIEAKEAISRKIFNVLESGGEVTELITLPSKEKLSKYGWAVPFSDMFGSSEYRYTADEYIKHLKAALDLSRKYKGYRVIPSNAVPSSIIMITHLDSDTFVAGTVAPTTVFHISHQQVSYAFFEYLERIEKDSFHQSDRMLSQYISGFTD